MMDIQEDRKRFTDNPISPARVLVLIVLFILVQNLYNRLSFSFDNRLWGFMISMVDPIFSGRDYLVVRLGSGILLR